MRQKKLGTGRLVEMYTEDHLTLGEIGLKVGMSRQAVHKRLVGAGVRAFDGEHVQTKCATCGNEVDILRKRWRSVRNVYCNQDCYAVYLENPEYNRWRQGSRLSRVIVSQHFRLEPEWIVHHKDFNQRNLDLANLAVYASTSDHMKMHHGAEIAPLWDGAHCECRNCINTRR